MESVADEALSVDIITNNDSERDSQSLPFPRAQCGDTPNFTRWRFLVGCAGAGCYETFSLFVTTPDTLQRLVRSSSLFSMVSNSLWISAHIGLCSYTFCSNMMRRFPLSVRLLYSITGGVMFNFGSVLLWAILKKVTQRDVFRAVSAILSGIMLLSVGGSFLSNSIQCDDDDDIPSTTDQN